MKTRAALLREVGQPLVIEEVDLEEPRAGEVLVWAFATGECGRERWGEFDALGMMQQLGLLPQADA